MKNDNKLNQLETYSISTSQLSNHKNNENKLEFKQNQKFISEQLILYLFEKINKEVEQNLSVIEEDYQQLIKYFLDYQHSLIDRQKQLYILLKGDYEDNIQQQQQQQNPPIFQILNKIIEKMKNGLNTTLIFQNCCHSGIHLLHTLNQIQQQENDQCKLYDENNRITILNIISINNQNTLQLKQQFSRILQSFTIIINPNQNFNCSDLFIDKNCSLKNLVISNQYFLPIHFKNKEQQQVKVTSQIQNLYKYFLKKKIIQFKPKIILLGIEIDKTFEIESYFLKKIIYQLNKISQNQLIIIPIRNSTVNLEQYSQTIIQCIYAINTYNQIKKNYIQENNDEMKAKNYLTWIECMSQTNKEKEFYKKQFQSLNVLQKFEQSIDDIQNTQEIFKFPIINSKNLIEYVILEDSHNGEYINVDSDTKYYVSYFNEINENKLTISIIKNQQLYFSEVNLIEIEIKNENKILMEKIAIFQDNPNSSYLLDQYKFYQVTLDVNELNQFVGNVIIYNFKINKNKFDKFSVQNDHEITSHIKGFTIIKHSDTSFSLLSGCKDGELYQQIGIKLDIVQQQNSLKLKQYYKQKNKLPKGYDYPLIAKFEPNNDQEYNKYLYFESQTKYFAIPIQSEIHKIIFQYNQSDICCQCDTIQNITNIELLQRYSRRFRSDKINLKYQQHNQNMILFQLVVFQKSYDHNNLNYTCNNKDIDFQKYQKYNYLDFKFYYYEKSLQTQLKIDLNINSIILEYKNNNLNQKCLYNNWLEDLNFQHIFFNRQKNIYLLYYLKDNSGQYIKKNFVFYCNENLEEYIPFDEVIINDYYNSVIWIVRKYQDINHPYLIIYSCHWMKLQDIKDDDINLQIKVKIDKILEINIKSKEFDLIGLEIRKSDNVLLICSSTFICQIPISKIKIDNCNLKSMQQQITEEKSLYQIFYTELNIFHNTPIILLILDENTIAFFYQYCLVNCLDDKKGLSQIEIKAILQFQKRQYDQNIENLLISNNNNNNRQNYDYYDQEEIQDNQDLIKQSFNYETSNTLILAKFISIEKKDQFLESSIFLEEEFRQFYIVQFKFTTNSNSILQLRIIHLQQSFGRIQFLKSISTNKYETLFLYDKSNQLIQSESTLEIFLNEQKENEQKGNDLESYRILNVQHKQQQLII